jgi:hypothetical protein
MSKPSKDTSNDGQKSSPSTEKPKLKEVQWPEPRMEDISQQQQQRQQQQQQQQQQSDYKPNT